MGAGAGEKGTERMKRWALLLLVIGELLLAGGQRTHAQGSGPRCPGDPRCAALSEQTIKEVKALSSYAIFRNPLLALTIGVGSPPEGVNSGLLYVDRPFEIGDENSPHCRLLVVGLANDDDLFTWEYEFLWEQSRTVDVHAFAFCRKINLLGQDGRPVLNNPPFPSSGEEISKISDFNLDKPAELVSLRNKLVENACPDSARGGGATVGLNSFTAQLAVFLLYHTDSILNDQWGDQQDAWQLFKKGGQTQLEKIRGDLFCLLAGSSVPTPVPTPTSTNTPVPLALMTPTPTSPVPIIRWTIEPGDHVPGVVTRVFGDTILDLLVRAAILIVAGVVLVVLVQRRSFRLVVIITAILVLGVFLAYLAGLDVLNQENSNKPDQTLTPTPAESATSQPSALLTPLPSATPTEGE
jgi:hypothetical protein